MPQVTELLGAASRGDAGALDRLFEALYADLRQLAHARLRKSPNATLLDTTSLVHESYLRFLKIGELRIVDQPHFFAYAARVMRSIVVDFIRQRMADRRGGGAANITLNTSIADSTPGREDEVLRIHEALEELATIDERLVRVVEMRYFAGMNEDEIALALGTSVRTVSRDWEKARLFLFASLK